MGCVSRKEPQSRSFYLVCPGRETSGVGVGFRGTRSPLKGIHTLSDGFSLQSYPRTPTCLRLDWIGPYHCLPKDLFLKIPFWTFWFDRVRFTALSHCVTGENFHLDHCQGRWWCLRRLRHDLTPAPDHSLRNNTNIFVLLTLCAVLDMSQILDGSFNERTCLGTRTEEIDTHREGVFSFHVFF